ncbi:MAG: MBL fold metallo-hydrolase [Nitratireductor sp.]
MTANDKYEVYAIRYAERSNRIRADSFIFTDDHTSSHPMDYFIWLIRNDERTILVDTGYDAKEAAQRDRPILVEPSAALADIGVAPDSIDSIIVTHLHYDHAGGLAQFPQARLHLQEAEMVYATGPCMCHGTLKMPFTADHVCENRETRLCRQGHFP